MSPLGSGPPNDLNGADGEYYLDVVTGEYYVKASGHWGAPKGKLQPWSSSGKDLTLDGGWRVGIGTAETADALLNIVGDKDKEALLVASSGYESERVGLFKASGTLRGFEIVEESRPESQAESEEPPTTSAVLAYGTSLRILDVTRPEKIVERGTYAAGAEVMGVCIDEHMAYVACGAQGLHAVDITDPAKPTRKQAVTMAGGATGPVRFSAGHAYVASGSSVRVFEEKEPDRSLSESAVYTGTAPVNHFAVTQADPRAVIAYAAFDKDLHVVDFSASPPTKKGLFQSTGTIAAIALQEEQRRVLIAWKSGATHGVQIIDVSDPASPVLIAACTPTAPVRAIAVENLALFYFLEDEGAIELARLEVEGPSKALGLLQRLSTEGLGEMAAIGVRGHSEPGVHVVYLGASTDGFATVKLRRNAINARIDGGVELLGDVFLKGLDEPGEGVLGVDEEGKIKVQPTLTMAELFERKVGPFVRIAGEIMIGLAANTGHHFLGYDRFGFPSPLVRTLVNMAAGGPGVADKYLDWVTLNHHIWETFDSIFTNTAIAASDFEIGVIHDSLGWKEGGTRAVHPDWSKQKAKYPWATQLFTFLEAIPIAQGVGWARQLGAHVKAQKPTAIVVGSGVDDANKLVSTEGVVLGSDSNVASVVIKPGAKDRAGSVAIGHASEIGDTAGPGPHPFRGSIAIGQHTKANSDDVVVIGAGLATSPLTAATPGSVTLGASDVASVVISRGSAGSAGSVAIGHESTIDQTVAGFPAARSVAIGKHTSATFDDAAAIGSGYDAAHKLTTDRAYTVALGAGSNQASIRIEQGAQDQAGSVAVGPRTNALNQVNAVVIGSGLPGNAPGGPLPLDAAPNAVVIGAHSNAPSIRVEQGAQDQAGSVAVGPRTTAVNHVNAVVLGSGLPSNAPGGPLALDAAPNAVVIGAHSNEPSIRVEQGAQNQAGSVAVGAKTSAAGQANAVVIGSGLAAHPLTAKAGAVVLGAGSNEPSVVITHGDRDEAGGVAIGHHSTVSDNARLGVAVGPFTKVAKDANAAVVVGSGDSDVRLLKATEERSLVLGAGSDKPSLVILPDPQGGPGRIRIMADVEFPSDAIDVNIGNKTKRVNELFISPHSIHIGEADNESVISHDTEARRLVLGNVRLGDVHAQALRLTGLGALTDDTNYIAVDRDGKVKRIPSGTADAERAKNEADRSEREANRAEREANRAAKDVKDALGEAGGAKWVWEGLKTAWDAAGHVVTAASAAETLAAAAVALKAAEAAAGAAALAVTTAGGSAAAAGVSAKKAEDAQAAAEGMKTELDNAKTAVLAAKDDAVKAKDAAVAAKTDVVKAKDEAVAAKTDAVKAKDEAVGAKTDAVKAKDEAVAAKTDAGKAKDDAVKAKDAAIIAQGAAEKAATAAAGTFSKGPIFVKGDHVGIGAPDPGNAKLAVAGIVKMDFAAGGGLLFQGNSNGNPGLVALGASVGLTISGEGGAKLPNISLEASTVTVGGVLRGRDRQAIYDQRRAARGGTAEAIRAAWPEYPKLAELAVRPDVEPYIWSRFAMRPGSVAVIRGTGFTANKPSGFDFAIDGGLGLGPQSIRLMNLTTGTFKTFIIDHPAHADKYLVHATLEGPEGAVYYRGTARLSAGKAVIEMPGYFEALTRRDGRTILLTNIDGFDTLAVRTQDGEKIKNGRFIVESSNPDSTQSFDWEVKAVREDIACLEVEPAKKDLAVERFGPYTYGVPRNKDR